MFDRLGRRHADIVRIGFNADRGKPLSPVITSQDGTTVLKSGKLFELAAWLDRYGYRWVTGSNGLWVCPQIGRAA